MLNHHPANVVFEMKPTPPFLAALQFLLDNGLWLAINIGIPVMLPYLIVGIIAIDEATGSGPGIARILMRKSVDTGQLFWTAIAMLAATMYDAVLAWDTHKGAHVAIGWIIGLCAILQLVCTLFVGLSTARSARSGSGINKFVIGISIGITLAMCCFYPYVHCSFAPVDKNTSATSAKNPAKIN